MLVCSWSSCWLHLQLKLPLKHRCPRCCVCLQINKYAFSGGGATVEEHRAKGANLDVDVPWKYLNFFMEDDKKLAHIGREYGAGRMLTGGSMPGGSDSALTRIAASSRYCACCREPESVLVADHR